MTSPTSEHQHAFIIPVEYEFTTDTKNAAIMVLQYVAVLRSARVTALRCPCGEEIKI